LKFLERCNLEDKKTEDTGETERTLFPRMEDRRKWSALGGILFVLILLMAGVYFYAFDRVGLHGTAMVDVPRNSTGRDIADTLEKKGVIRSSTLFRLYSRILGSGKSLQSGTYKMKQGMTVKEAMTKLRSGMTESVFVTVPEGYTVHQIAALLDEAGVKGADDFEGEAASYGPLKYQYGPLPVSVKAEGFLFPDTYNIPKEYTARQICDMMYKRTDDMLTPEIRKKAQAKHLTLHALITLASMVEREARFKEDQEPIASVMLKRLSIGMPLQIDATIQYALPHFRYFIVLAVYAGQVAAGEENGAGAPAACNAGFLPMVEGSPGNDGKHGGAAVSHISFILYRYFSFYFTCPGAQVAYTHDVLPFRRLFAGYFFIVAQEAKDFLFLMEE
jgi:UPF0755 protein